MAQRTCPPSLVTLTEACDLDTSGLNWEGVVDETYPKAAKLDASKFSITFDPIRCGLVDAIKDQIFRGDLADVPLNYELPKLNVYGKHAFFKAYGDTPNDNITCSLVTIFPTPYSGGEFLFRHHFYEQEWTIDGASLISSQPSLTKPR